MTTTRRLLAVLTLASLAGSVSVGHAAESDGPGRGPKLGFAKRLQGKEAIAAMGARLTEVAQYHRMKPDRLKAMLEKDHDLWVTAESELQYICEGLACPEHAETEQALSTNGPDSSFDAPYALTETFLLHSRPSATKTIFLDFDGHSLPYTPWENGGALKVGAFYSNFNDPVIKTQIQKIWAAVAEDYAPFDVDVTTEDPGSEALRKSGTGDTQWGIRVAFTKNLNLLTGKAITNAGGGGTAYYNSFNWSTDDIALVFNTGEYTGAQTASHEIGHTLGLTHMGAGTSTEYYGGHGAGETSWAPIMGASWLGNDEKVVQWTKGEYFNANNVQDELSTITTGNGFGYRIDDYGNTISTAYPLVQTGNVFSARGVVEQQTDSDFFKFTVAGGSATITVNPYYAAPNLDVLARLYAANGTLVQEANPAGTLNATISAPLVAGSYYLSVAGTGFGTPFTNPPTGYTSYDSLGQYALSITMTSATNRAPVANAQSVSTAEDTAKAITLTATDADGDALSYTIVALPTHGTLSGTGASRTYTPTANYSGADSFTFLASDAKTNSNVATVSITVTAVNDTPTCALTAPVNGTSYSAPASIPLQATASDVDGTIAKVEFFNGATKLGEKTNSPYAYAWSGVAAGSYTLTAKATDNSGASTTSAAARITVTAVTNQLPIVSFVKPSNGAHFPAGSTVIVEVGASDPDGTISNVKLYLNGQLVRQENVAPYTWGESGQNDVLMTGMLAGTYTLEAVATDNVGATRSATILITVAAAANQPPVANAQSVTNAEDTAKVITLTGSDPEGSNLTYTVVANPAHGTLSGTGASRTYMPAANYSGSDSFTFLASDGKTNSNVATVSITVTAVNDNPTVTAGGTPTSGTAPLTVNFTATGADVDGDTLSYGWTFGDAGSSTAQNPSHVYAAAGTYAAVVTVSDGKGGTASANVAITVTAAGGPVGYTWCASENQSYTFTQTVDVAYGANGKFNYKYGVTGTIVFNNATFGDPIVGTIKAGYYKVVAGNQAPVAMAGVNPESGTITNEYYFWATQSFDPDGTIAAYEWQIGGVLVSTNAEFLHMFATGGTYTVTLTVRDSAGASDCDTVVVNVSEPVPPMVAVAVSDTTAGEPGLAEGTGKFIISRSGDLTQAITVRYAMSGTASNGVDCTKLSGSVSLAVGKASASVTLTPLADALMEGNEIAIMTLQPGIGYTVDGTRLAGTVTIKDQTYDTPIVSAVSTDASSVEPGLTVNKGAIKISRTGSCHAALTVQATMSGSAVNGVDYTTVSVPVTLAIGQSSKTLTITPLADGVVDSNETVVLTIQTAAAYLIGAGQASATVTIADTTQLATPVVSVVATDATSVEPTLTVNKGTFTFKRTSRFHEALVVNYTLGGTATNGVDYSAVGSTITIPVGVATKTLTITPKADGVVEGMETVIVTISASTAYSIDSTKGAGIVTIGD